MPKRRTKEEWIELAEEKHAGQYDYSEVEYINNYTKVRIRCREHGIFLQSPVSHSSRGAGCLDCSHDNRRLDIETVIQQFRDVHGDKYDYSNVVYKNVDTRVKIGCSIHGEFFRSPYSHKNGQGCPDCADKYRPNRRLGLEKWIERWRDRHGDAYDYSLVEDDITIGSFVTIVCREHGEFQQRAGEHARYGCKRCHQPNRGIGTQGWIGLFEEVHAKRYDYSKFEYKRQNVLSTIICNDHGEFQQQPVVHLQGSGCTRCHYMRGATTEEWIQRCKEIHGDTYDYSKMDYVRHPDKVTIICKIHGDFEMLIGNHVHKTRPQGCGKCAGKGLTNEDWIERFQNKHGTRYDYSKFVYEGAQGKITIICPDHGEMTTTVHNHLKSPTGCERCSSEQTGLNQRRSQEEIIQSFIARHGDRYDYSKVEYKGDKHNVLIICSAHGEFWQRAIAHANGRNCNDCMNIEAGLNRRLSREDAIARAIEMHGDKYDYSKFEYSTIEDDMIIICPEHGEFVQKVNNHINQGNACRKCALIEGGLKRRVTDEEWRKRFNDVHGDKYDYSNFQSNGSMNKAIITCRVHDEFPQEPIVHANGHGCPKCLKKNQTQVYEFLTEIFPVQEIFYDFKHPELRFSRSNAKMELDIWIPEISLAVEYQGEQHFETFWKGVVDLSESETLESQQRRDEEKRKACIENGITLIEIPYTWDKTLTYIINALSESDIEF